MTGLFLRQARSHLIAQELADAKDFTVQAAVFEEVDRFAKHKFDIVNKTTTRIDGCIIILDDNSVLVLKYDSSRVLAIDPIEIKGDLADSLGSNNVACINNLFGVTHHIFHK